MTQMLGQNVQGDGKESVLRPKSQPKIILALELLRGCGMILRARRRTSPAQRRCYWALSFAVHHSSVICCNVLNLSSGSRV